MKNFRADSIKMRITLWYTAFIVVIIAILLGVLLISQDVSSQDYYADLLRETIDDIASRIKTAEDIAALETQTDRGVHITVMTADRELIAGRRKFTVEPKEDTMRARRANNDDFWYLMDKPMELEDGSEIWLRCYISSAVSDRLNQTILTFLMIMLPVLLAAAVIGGFSLTRRAFRPLDRIIHTAENISATTDLKQRFRVGSQADEVGKLAETFDGMLVRLERSLEDEKSFISNASHELRTPIGVICAQSEYALNPERTVKEKDKALQIIHSRSVKAGQMLSQMLLLSRMDFDRVPMNFERIDLSQLLLQIAQEMDFRADEKNIAVCCDVRNGIFCRCDELLMIRMVTNLLENAVQYGRENGKIVLSLRESGTNVVISVEDDGIGIAEQDIKRIWQRFYQVNKSEDKVSGFGLGLSFVQWIASAHGGSASVESVLGKGSVFTVEIPTGE